MSDAERSETTENLRRAFARDAALEARCVYFARLAEFEGLSDVAAMFRQVAEAGRVVVDGHLDFLVPVADPLTAAPLGDTEANLAASVAEHVESAALCADYARIARAEGLHAAASWFESVVRGKGAHLDRLESARRALGGGSPT